MRLFSLLALVRPIAGMAPIAVLAGLLATAPIGCGSTPALPGGSGGGDNGRGATDDGAGDAGSTDGGGGESSADSGSAEREAGTSPDGASGDGSTDSAGGSETGTTESAGTSEGSGGTGTSANGTGGTGTTGVRAAGPVGEPTEGVSIPAGGTAVLTVGLGSIRNESGQPQSPPAMASIAPNLTVGQPLPTTTLARLNGDGSITFPGTGAPEGGVPRLIVLWNSWDPAYVERISGWLAPIAQRSDRIAVTSVGLPMLDSADRQAEVRSANGWNWPHAVAESADDVWGVRAGPVAILLDADGRVTTFGLLAAPSFGEPLRAWLRHQAGLTTN